MKKAMIVLCVVAVVTLLIMMISGCEPSSAAPPKKASVTSPPVKSDRTISQEEFSRILRESAALEQNSSSAIKPVCHLFGRRPRCGCAYMQPRPRRRCCPGPSFCLDLFGLLNFKVSAWGGGGYYPSPQPQRQNCSGCHNHQPQSVEPPEPPLEPIPEPQEYSPSYDRTYGQPYYNGGYRPLQAASSGYYGQRWTPRGDGTYTVTHTRR